MALVVNTTTVVNSNRSFTLGTATPGSPVTGMIRYNSGAATFEFYNGTVWVDMATEKRVIWSWGNNYGGALGDNTTTMRNSPVSVVGGITNWTQITTGEAVTGAIRADGTAWAWGYNRFGRLGDNTTVNRSSPVSVVGGITNWVEILPGEKTVARRADGTAWSWGRNNSGQLGDNTTVDKSSPVSVVGGITNWVQISGGPFHTAGRRSDGTIWTWGVNYRGRLGDNTTVNRSSPVSVVGGITNWVDVSGKGSTTAVRADGTAWCWGRNNRGQLGDNTTVSRSSPVSVVGGITNWTQIGNGYFSTTALRTNGTIWSWGRNSYGQLGDNTTVDKSSPVSVVGGITDWVQISVGNEHVAALRANGTIWTWGFNGGYVNTGALGDGTFQNRSSPVSVVGGFTDWVQISAGGSHTAALRSL
jgi:alpha-tubulin suppressor-like RCC1 family protein